jgi:hypothetical protein
MRKSTHRGTRRDDVVREHRWTEPYHLTLRTQPRPLA